MAATSASDSVTPDSTVGTSSIANDDIWASDDDHNTTSELHSDLPIVRRQHMTSGYREGLSVGKSKVMQKGFDDGYPIGVAIAMRAGKVLGWLEGCLAVKGLDEGKVKDLTRLHAQAKEELAITSLTKSLNDEIVAEARGVPAKVEQVLREWEIMIFEVGGEGTD